MLLWLSSIKAAFSFSHSHLSHAEQSLDGDLQVHAQHQIQSCLLAGRSSEGVHRPPQQQYERGKGVEHVIQL